jgi:hypothetical protein
MVSVLAEVETPIREGKRMGRKASETIQVTVEMKLPKGVADVLIGKETALSGQICKYQSEAIITRYADDFNSTWRLVPEANRPPQAYRAEVPAERAEAERVLDFAREVMHTLFEQHGITPSQFARLTELQHRHAVKMLPLHPANEHGVILCGHFFEGADGGVFANLSMAVIAIMVKLVQGEHSLLTKCPVCKTLFVRDSGRPTQRYDCSTCRNLYNVHRQRGQKN